MLRWLSFNYGIIFFYMKYIEFSVMSSSNENVDSPGGLSECVFEYSSTLIANGEVYSPNYPNPYPNNLNCRYEFTALENERVIIQVDDFELEPAQNTNIQDINFMDFIETVTRPNSNRQNNEQPLTTSHSPIDSNREADAPDKQCFYDFLDVFSSDGIGHLYWMARYCGQTIPSQIVSTSPTLILVFKTDRMLGFRGFKLRFHFSYLNILPFVTDVRCGNSEIVGNGSILGSPNYPKAYPSQIECAWTISVEKSKKILVKFIDVNFGTQSCAQSYVSIWDGYVSDVQRPQFTVCQKLIYYHKSVMKYESKSNRLVVKFVGNKNLVESGGPSPEEETYWNNNTRKSGNSDSNYEAKIGFFMSWTAVTLEDDCTPAEFQCEGGEYCIDTKNFLCQETNRYCLSKSLVCDGVLNCDIGDESDEKNCELSFLKSKLYLMAIAISLVVFVILTVFCCLVHYLNKKNLKRKVDAKNRTKAREVKTHENEVEFSALKSMPSMPIPRFIDFSNHAQSGSNKRESTSTCHSENDEEFEVTKSRPSQMRKIDVKPLGRAINSNMSGFTFGNDTTSKKQENEIAVIRREYRLQQMVEQNVLLGRKNNGNKDLKEYSNNTRISTPTYSSSLPSENSLSSPIVETFSQLQQHQPKIFTKSEQMSPMGAPKSVVEMQNTTPNRFSISERFKKFEDVNNSLRRNSYTKAIFYENEKI